MAKLPTVVSNLAPDLRAFLNRVREAIDGKGGDRLVSVDDLLTGGVVVPGPGGTLVPPTTPVKVGTPPAPTSVSVTGGVFSMFIEWSDPKYYGHAHAEIWGGETNNLGTAVLLGMAPGVNYVDSVQPSTSRYYWVRFVNILDVAGPYNAVGGTFGETQPDVDYLLDVLTDSITESQLYGDLGARIDLIDGPVTLANSVAARILEEAEARGAAITTERTLRQTADTSLASQITTVTAAVGANAAAIQTEAIARADADSAEAVLRTTLAARVTGSEGAILEESRVRASADGVLSERITALVAKVDDPSTGLPATRAAVINIENAKIGYCTIGGVTSDQVDRPTCEAAGGVWNVGLPLARAVKQISVSDGDNALSLEQRFTAQKNTNGTLSGQYTVKIDNNGYVSGFGLASTPVNGTPFADFTIRADRFSISAPTGPGIPELTPFTVVTTQQNINGTIVNPGVYIDGATIRGGSITGSAIVNGTIEGTKLINVSANLITGAALQSTSFIESAGYIQGASGWKIYGNGTAEFAAASIRGTLTAGQIDTRGLTIKDANGNIIFGSGFPLNYNSLTGTPSFGSLAFQSSVDYGNIGGTKPPTNATRNAVFSSPNMPVFGVFEGDFWNDTSSTQAKVWTYLSGAWRLTGTEGATFNSGAGRVSGQITDTNVTTFIASAAIGNAQIGSLSASKITAGNISVNQYIQSSNYSAGSAGWNINGNGNAEFNGLTVRSGQVTGALLKAVKVNSFSGTYVEISGGNPISTTGGPYYLNGSSPPQYLVGYYIMPAPEVATAPHKIAAVINVQSTGGGQNKDLAVLLIANASVSGTTISGEQVAYNTNSGVFGLATNGSGVTNGLYATDTIFAVFVGGFNAAYTIQTIDGILFGVR